MNAFYAYRKWYFVLFTLSVISLNVFAQDQNKIDSIQKVLQHPIADTMRVQTLLALAGELYNDHPDQAIQQCEKARQLSTTINYTDGLSNALGWLAFLYEQQGDIKKALDYYQQSLTLFEKSGSKRDAATVLNNMAAIYKDQGQIEQAIALNEKSLAIKIEIHDSDGIATTYNNMGLIYSNQGQIPEALEYYMKALSIEEKINNTEGIATAFQNIGFIYKDQKQYSEAMSFFRRALEIEIKTNDKYSSAYSYNALGGVQEELNRPDSALYFYNKALELRIALGDKQGIAYSQKNIGMAYEKAGNISLAKNYYRESLAGFESLGDKWGIAISTNLYGAALFSTGNVAEALPLLERSLATAKELGYPADIRNAADNLGKLYRSKQSWKQALEMTDLYIQMRDSVQNDKNRKISLQTKFRYEYEKKEAKLRSEQEKKDAIAAAELKRQKQVRNGFIAGFAIVLFFGVIVLMQRNRIQKGKKRSDELLHNILPEEVAEELKLNGNANARQFDQVTVMFTDFKSFTQISEKLSPAELVKDIDTLFRAFDAIIDKYKIEKIKTIGDSYMAAGGLPVVDNSHASLVVSAALEIRNYMNRFNDERKKLNQDLFEIRIGIHSGPVVAGIVGVKKFAYDIWGDTVNIASRMESSADTGQINISQNTYELVKNQFVCIHRGKIKAKNKGEIDMYSVTGSNKE